MLISCADTRKSSGVITSREATAIWHAYEILPNYHYYYAGPDAQPFYVVGNDDRYKLMAKLWKSVDLTPEMLRNWGTLKPKERGVASSFFTSCQE